MKAISSVTGGEINPQQPTTGVENTSKSSESVFLKYDTDKKGNYGEVTAKELSIDEKLNDALKTLDDLAKSVPSSAVAKTINTLKNMANALLNGIVKYDTNNTDTIDGALADCEERIADAKNISDVVKQLEEDAEKGVQQFKRQIFASKTAVEALENDEHNTNVANLAKLDKKNKKEAVVLPQMQKLFKQAIEQAIGNGKDFDKSELMAVHAGVSDIKVSAKPFAKANELKGETRNEKGQQIIKKDATEITLTYTFEGQTYTLKETVDKVPKGIPVEFIRENDKGIDVSISEENVIRYD